MSAAFEEFLATVLVYVCIYTIASWGLNIQFGAAGIINFGFIIFQSIGAYTVALCTLGHSGLAQGEETAFAAFHLPFPLPLVVATVVGAVFSGLVGVVVLSRVKKDQQAVILFVLSLIAIYVVDAIPSFLNGPTGLALIPQPFASSAVPGTTYDWVFVGCLGVLTAGCWLVVRALHESPYGRALRALRANDVAAEALGYNVFSLRITAFCAGGALAALTGGIFAYYITTWSPASWGYQETFWFFTCVIVGGMGNLGGIVVGSAVIVGIQEGLGYIPALSTSNVGIALQGVLAAAITIVFLWVRPQGLFPERLHRTYGSAKSPSMHLADIRGRREMATVDAEG